jgi:mRNA-degrading endonuclease RelE of RelBE toxin-antitoxin system
MYVIMTFPTSRSSDTNPPLLRPFTLVQYEHFPAFDCDHERIHGSGDVRRLKGIAGCRLRIGDWRVIFIEDARSITVVAVGNRKKIYD